MPQTEAGRYGARNSPAEGAFGPPSVRLLVVETPLVFCLLPAEARCL